MEEPRVVWTQGCELPKPEKLLRLWNDPNYVADIKINGIRATVHFMEKGNRMFTRSASKFDPTRPIEFTHRFPRLANMPAWDVPAGTILDGEVFSPLRRHEEVAGFLNPKNDGPTAPEDFRFICFDCLFWGEEDMRAEPWWKRRSVVELAVVRLQSPTLVQRSAVVKGNKKAFYDSIVAAGGEGVVLKLVTAPYFEGKKPANIWVKAKVGEDFDCVVIGFTAAKKGKFFGQIGAMEFGQYVQTGSYNNLPIYTMMKVGQASGMSDAIRKDMSNNPDKYLGKVVVVSAQERIGGKLSLQNPQFEYIRIEGDKSPEECIAKGVVMKLNDNK